MLDAAGACTVYPHAMSIAILHVHATDGRSFAHDLQGDAVLVVTWVFPMRAVPVHADIRNVYAFEVGGRSPIRRNDDGANGARVHPTVMVIAQFS